MDDYTRKNGEVVKYRYQKLVRGIKYKGWIVELIDLHLDENNAPARIIHATNPATGEMMEHEATAYGDSDKVFYRAKRYIDKA